MAKTSAPVEITPIFLDKLKDIPGADGFWKYRAELSYLTAAQTMVKAGISEERVLDILTELYWDTAECFGGC